MLVIGLEDDDALQLHDGREPLLDGLDAVLHVQDATFGSVPGSKMIRIVASPALVPAETM